MRILASVRWRILAIARRLGYAGNPRLHEVEVPLGAVVAAPLLARLDSGMYEEKEISLIRRFLPRDADVLELGASMGIVSAFILGRHPRRLVSYEAVPEMADRARQVVTHNCPSPNWELVNAAVVPQPADTVSFHWSPQVSDSGSLASSRGMKEIVVPAFTLGQMLDRHGLGPGAWLVMDIEGAEHDVIRHSSAALDSLEGIILEVHDTPKDTAEDAIRALQAKGFKLIGRRRRVVALRR